MASPAFGLQTIALDLPALVAAFGRRLHDAGVPVSAERAARLAEALEVVGRAGFVSRRRLYFAARAVLVADRSQVGAFDAVFAEVFGGGEASQADTAVQDVEQVPSDVDEPTRCAQRVVRAGGDSQLGGDRSSAGASPAPGRSGERAAERELPVPMVASADEVLRSKRFDALEPDELARLYALMSRIALATPWRRTRRFERGRHGGRVDLRATLRASRRTGGDPIHLARRRRRVQRRRIVMLCDISGSMEPYARAYLQFLTCAAGRAGADRNEAFVFATRLTRLTRALRGAGGSRSPERAIAHAARTAPDWSSGTRIGDALATFNDRHGRRGMARGAVVVILSDGWELGDPALVGREMERLARLAHRIVWVNPRVVASGFHPRTGGMAAALPHCDALVSGHSLDALDDVVAAIAARGGGGRGVAAPVAAVDQPEPESWASATPVPGSSVAMPSGYGPSRGRTTPGWAAPR